MRLRFESFGCALNRGQARELEELAAGEGHRTGAIEAEADLIVMITCTVVQATENRMLARLETLRERGKRVLVAGCMASAQAGIVRKACPGAALIAPHDYARFPALLHELGGRPAGGGKRDAPAVAVADVPVADGCNGHCTFCITRLARGTPVSRPVDEIAARVEKLVGRGCLEVRLAAQDIGLYGQDLGADLPGLLARLCALDGDFRLRVGMMNPESLLPMIGRLMDSFKHPKVFKFLHVPVQSGDDGVLGRMGRGHPAADFEKAAGRFRREFPQGVLATDIIAGFPGEDERAFERTLELVKRTGPDIINIKAYSPRPGTPAFRMKGGAGRAVVKRRIARLQALRRRISLANNRRLAGTVQEVLVTEKARKGGVMGRTDGYFPVILDGGAPIGGHLAVEIIGARAGFLVGRGWPVSKSNTESSNKAL
jgi:MiaB-like tRNA modifying enzyme